MKVCSKCGVEQPLENFHRNRAQSDGHHALCKTCRKKESHARYLGNKERIIEQTRAYAVCHREQHHTTYRRHSLRKLYGLTLEDYDMLWEKQRGLCAICRNPEASRGMLRVDHDHVTGKVRGLLCHKCNTGIGLLGDSIAHLLAATDYLEVA